MHTPFCTFLCRRCTTTTWICLISRFVGDANTRRPSFSRSELWYSPLEFNSRKICQHLTNWTWWNTRDKVCSSTKTLFNLGFRIRRRRSCFSSLLAKQQLCACITLLCKFLQLPLLHDYDVKILNFTFSSPEFRYSPSEFNTRKIFRIERDGINAVNFKVAPTPTKEPTKNCQTDSLP